MIQSMKKNRRVFPRCPVPKKEFLRENFPRWAHQDGISVEQEIHRYLHTRISEILGSREKIEDVTKRENIRIEKTKRCIEIALECIEDESERDRIRKYVFEKLGD